MQTPLLQSHENKFKKIWREGLRPQVLQEGKKMAVLAEVALADQGVFKRLKAEQFLSIRSATSVSLKVVERKHVGHKKVPCVEQNGITVEGKHIPTGRSRGACLL